MSWARFSDTFYRNDKQLAMSDGAFRVYVCAICFAMQDPELTGFLTNAQLLGFVRFLHKRLAVRDELVSLNAWEEVADGILIHDFELYIEPTSRARTKAWRDRKRAERDVPVTSPSVTPPPPGDVTVTPLARRVSPVPVPVPVVLKEPSVGSLDKETQKLGLLVLSWFRDRHDSETSMPVDLSRERPKAMGIATMQIPHDLLFATLNEVWERAKKKPISLNYFSGPLGEAESAAKNELAATRGFDAGNAFHMVRSIQA